MRLTGAAPVLLGAVLALSCGIAFSAKFSWKSASVGPQVDPKLLEEIVNGGSSPVYAYVVDTGGLVPIGYEYEIKAGKPSPGSGSMAWCSYRRTHNHTGWGTLEIHTNSSLDDLQQMAMAGYLEGLVTGVAVYQHVINVGLDQYCQQKSDYCTRLDKFLSDNEEWSKQMIERGQTLFTEEERAFWHQYELVQSQSLGLQFGYNVLANYASLPQMSDRLLMLLRLYSDLDTIESALGKPANTKVVGSGSCSAMVKVIGDYEDILFTHDTWTHYNSMLRIFKYYDIPVKRDKSSEASTVAGRQVSFSSYPGFLHSNDDFYTLNSGLAVMETTNGNYNESLFKAVGPHTAMYFYRVIIANRLSSSTADWAHYFSMYNSGTYNNQWMVFDYNKFTPGSALKSGALLVLEQLPTYIHSEDMTHYLQANRYWSSYNIPFFSSVYDMSGFPAMVHKFGDFFDHQLCPRGRIFTRDHGKVTNLESLMRLMRYNDFKHDPYSRCTCEPPYSGENAIAARSDLNPANGTYLIPAEGHRMHGATDCKITSSEMMTKLQAQAVSAPTHDTQPIFKWSSSGVSQPLGHPDVFNFNFTLISWEEV